MRSRIWAFAFWIWLFAALVGVFGCKGAVTPVNAPQDAPGTEKPQYLDDDATNKNAQMLKAQGYVHIQLFGWRPFKCADSDNAMYTDAFEADFKSTGAHVSGTICGAVFKGKTIRLD